MNRHDFIDDGIEASAGGIYPIGSSSLYWLSQYIHAKVAVPTIPWFARAPAVNQFRFVKAINDFFERIVVTIASAAP